MSDSKLLLAGNQSLILDNPQTVWQIESGAIAVFAIPIQQGIEGVRRYLFGVNPGEVLFGVSADNHKILAISIEDTVLLQISVQECEEGIRQEKDEAESLLQLVQIWEKNIQSCVGDRSSIPTVFSHPENLTNWNAIQVTLSELHDNLCEILTQIEQEESATKWTQFQAREQLNSQAKVNALGELASVLKPKQAELMQTGTPLLIAAGAVGRALGIKILPPVRSEDMNRIKEPLEAIARASRIRIRRVLLNDRWWQKDSGPLLAYTNQDNFPVALLPAGVGKYEIFDPQKHVRIPVNKDTAQQLAPFAHVFYRPIPENNVTAIDLLLFAFKGKIRELVVIFLTGVVGALLGMLTPLATAILIDSVIPDADRGLLMQIGLGLIAATFGTIIFQIAQGFAGLRLESKASLDSQAALWDRLFNLRVSFFREYSIGDLQSRVSAVTQIRQKLNDTVLRTVFTSFFSLLNLGLLFIYSSSLALVVVAVALVAIIFTTISSVLSRQKLRALEEIEGEIFGFTVQMVAGVSKLRVSNAEDRAFAYWAKKYSQQLKLKLSTEVIEDVLAIFNTAMPTVSSIIIFWLAVTLITQAPSQSQTGLSTGTFLAFNSAFAIFIAGATQLSNTIVSILDISIFWERAKPIFQAQPEIDLSKSDPGRLTGKVKVDRVTFRYREDGPLNLDDLTIEADPGELIALVGPSGSGKSTIIRLLLGFETPKDGTIYYDGQDLSGLDTSAVRRQIGVVLQNGRINSASIFENISSGALVTMDEAWEAVRMAGFADDIKSMPMEMHTVISEGGTNLSGGQRQRLLIARALVLKPRIIIFDEATSALDNRTQAIVSTSLDQLGVTRIIIAHRLSTIRNADRIYVIEAGRVVQQGRFEELVNQKGLFANLMARQMT
ncbi:NHLP bacteriocin export ABC transporter permease/ATPase subunit [Nostoc sp. 'Peltigera membranacea cyanobiont' N6]|uniref:NHLP bacteriocin export ABC transporter permease/ATPase subunit n=1 Tax=Nostoc sp. 'Peltigera membranacea cyanobiont' N6 TaxID=1261031 RepID=UPI000CF31CBA|nr:NHLP bacteriocin export ABC transporter permease/ATPase subunit [Nostoc sp. 'Peltigera membranacea cyanobiont' N6]AVH67308.1 NHLM bacteriocin system ABC transporter ATP-binding protein [Nostoc sp. 'Peltigera membranacea cyanobiont' N6]